MRSFRPVMIVAAATACLCSGAATAADAVATPAPIEHFRVFPGFVGEVKSEEGWTTAFAAQNPWGQYTAYLMSTNAKGQRTIRIEQYFPIARAEARGLQGTTMYLLEGRDRALLIDTGNPATATDNVNDLKTVVRYILAHESDGSLKAKPLDFVVANTHSHGDHTGQNFRMWDRPFYYMDLDWPALAPSNWVPIREGGGATTHGNGRAVGEIDLGERVLKAVAVPPHTPGSTAYLDAENQMLFSGDAIGCAFVWVQIGPLATYLASTRRLYEVTAPYPQLAVFGSHFYQYALGPRRDAPVNGRPGDRQYILDQGDLAEALLKGEVVGEAYENGRELVMATGRSAQIVYSLATMVPAGTTPRAPYQAVRIPATYPAQWQITAEQKATLGIRADFFLVRGPKGEVFHLLKGSKKSVLIGAGSGAPGLKAFVQKLVGTGPLEVVLTDDDADQRGGLAQLGGVRVHAPAGTVKGRASVPLKAGEVLDLGLDTAGRPLRLEVHALGASFTLLDVSDRILFTGRALGVQGADSGWTPPGGAAAYRAAVAAWRAGTDGRYVSLYTSRNHQWFTSPAYVDQLLQALDLAVAGKTQKVESRVQPGLPMIRSSGAADIVASIGVP